MICELPSPNVCAKVHKKCFKMILIHTQNQENSTKTRCINYFNSFVDMFPTDFFLILFVRFIIHTHSKKCW